MKLTVIIDDIRDCGVDMIFRNGEAAQHVWPLIRKDVRLLLIDHDLGGGMTGYDFLKWVRDETLIYPPSKQWNKFVNDDLPREMALVTSNPVGRKNMEALIINDLGYVKSEGSHVYIREEVSWI